MTVRSRFRRVQERVFKVNLTVHRLESIPAIHRDLFVHWSARRATPSTGRTPSQRVEPGNVVNWNSTCVFNVTIPSEITDPTMLQPAPLTLQLRSEKTSRWISSTSSYTPEGKVELDMSEIAALSKVSKNYLVQDSLLNTTLKVTIRVLHESGDKIFRTRSALGAVSAYTVSAANNSSGNVIGDVGGQEVITTNQPTSPVPTEEIMQLYYENDRQPSAMDSQQQSYTSTTSRFPKPPQPPAPAPSAPPSSSSSSTTSNSRSFLKPPSSATTARGLQKPPPPSLSSASTITASQATSPYSLFVKALDNDTPLLNINNDDSVANRLLVKSIPDPELVQQHVYEEMFRQRMRDHSQWPSHIVQSRVNAEAVVTEVFASVCGTDGIVTVSTKDFIMSGAASNSTSSVPVDVSSRGQST